MHCDMNKDGCLSKTLQVNMPVTYQTKKKKLIQFHVIIPNKFIYVLQLWHNLGPHHATNIEYN